MHNVLYTEIMYYRNRQSEAVGSMQFLYSPSAKNSFYIFKKLFRKENTDRGSLRHTTPKIFTTCSLQKLFATHIKI